MTADSGGRLRRLGRLATRQPMTLWSGVGGAAVLAALSLGGFQPEDTTAVEPLVVGAPVDVGPFDVTVQRMRVVDELPGVSEGDDTTRVLALVATVTTNGPRTRHGRLLDTSVTLTGVDGIDTADGEPADGTAQVPAEAAWVMADGTRLDALQPGLEYEVALVWEQDTSAAVPDAAHLVLVGRTLRESSIDRTEQWFDPEPMVAGEVEVTVPGAEDEDDS